MELWNSLLCSPVGRYPESDESSPHPHTLFQCPPSTPSLPSCLFLSGFTLKLEFISHPSHSCYNPRLYQPPTFDHSINHIQTQPSGSSCRTQFVSFDVVSLFTKVIIPLKHNGNYRVFVEESSRLTLFSSACARNTHTIRGKETQSCISVVMPRIMNT
jgi:hypothetical protein